MGFIKTPNLPQSSASVIVGGELLKPYESALKRLKTDVLYTDDNTKFNSSLKSHADLFVSYLGEGRIIIDNSQKRLINELKRQGFSVDYPDLPVGPDYPDDCRLNCVLTDDIIICNESITDRKILEFAAKKGFKTVNVRQGYCKCSVVTVNENAFITDDIGIFEALKALKYDVLKVEKGSVALKGYNYGFIGGCCGKISENLIAFCGNIEKHYNYEDIKYFLRNYNIDAVSLSDGQLTDVGSLIPVIQK